MHILCPHCRNPIEVVRLTPAEEIACPSCGSSFRLEMESTTGPDRSAGQKLGKFELLAVLGQGAFGTVYRARDPELDRTVALKVPRAGNLAGPHELDRFLREARSAAQLRHPSIVPVHEVGQEGGVPYLVSDFVQGVTLADLLSARRPGFRESAQLVAAIADALQYAHERGVVHRDVKPSNVMIGDDGTPCVMDFGLAKREAGEITMTVEGQVLGTPAYMPPEQARGEGHLVDRRGDVYSLGVVLYQLLTGELPFRGTHRMLLHQVLHDDPRPPRRLNDRVPRDLETVCLKAMAREPARRYQTAGELADDLRRWLKGEPILARPVGRLERAIRWARRHPATVALLAVSGVAVLALGGLAVGLFYNAELGRAYEKESSARAAEEEQRKRAEEALGVAEEARRGEAAERKKAVEALALAERLGYFHSVSLANVALKDHDTHMANHRLQECKPGQRGWEWHYLNARCHTELFSLDGTVTFSPDGTRIAVAATEPPGGIRICDVRTGREVVRLEGQRPPGVPAFSPDGTRIAVAPSRGGAVRVYDARTGKGLVTLDGKGRFHSATFSPDGARIAVSPLGRGDGGVPVHDARTGQEAFVLKGSQRLGSPVFSPDGARIAAFGAGVLQVHDARTGQLVFSRMGQGWQTTPVFSGDGARLAWTHDGVLEVYEAATGRTTVTLKGPRGLGGGVFSPDGARIAAGPAIGGGDGVVRVYDARTGREVFSLKAPAPLSSPQFSPDGALLTCWGGDGVVRVCDAHTGQEVFALEAPVRLNPSSFSPDGSLLACRGSDGVTRLYDARADAEPLFRRSLAGADRPVFSPDGTRLVFPPASGGRVIRVYDVRTGLRLFTIEGPALIGLLPFMFRLKPVFSPDGARIAVQMTENGLGGGGVVRLYDAWTGRETLVLKGPAPLGVPVFSADSARVAVEPAAKGRKGDGVVRVYDARTGQETLVLKGPAPLGAPVFSPDGARIAVTPASQGGDGAVRVYDARTGREAFAVKGPKPLGVPVFSPDGAGIAVVPAWNAGGGGGGEVRVYDARTGKQRLVLQGPMPFSSIVFSPDGTRIAAAPSQGEVRVYDAGTGKEAFALQGRSSFGPPVFSPDGSRLAAGASRVVWLYDAHTGKEALTIHGPEGFAAPVFSPDGARLAIFSQDMLRGLREVRIYQAPRKTEAWQAERRKALLEGLPAWHRVQAVESQRPGRWFAAAFHWGQLARTEPASGQPRLRRGFALARLGRAAQAKKEFEAALARKTDLGDSDQADAHAMLGQWDDAARLLGKAVEAPTASAAVWLRHAQIRLQQGDQQGYRQACAGMIGRFGKATDASTGNTVAWACALGPEALPDLKPALQLASVAVLANAKDAGVRNTLGAVLYRAGRYKEALAELNTALKLSRSGGTAADFLFLALAHHRLGDAGEARKRLEQARTASEKSPPVIWNEQLELRLLLSEAERTLLGKDKPGKEGSPGGIRGAGQRVGRAGSGG